MDSVRMEKAIMQIFIFVTRRLISQLDPRHTIRASRKTMRGKTRLQLQTTAQGENNDKTANHYASLAKHF